MAKDVDLTSREWLNLVFEGKNKEYGAYELRDSSSDRHLKALLIVTMVGLALIFLPRLVTSVIPQPDRVVISGGVFISDLGETPPAKPAETVAAIIPPSLEVRKSIQFTPPRIVDDQAVRNEVATQIDLSDPTAVIAIHTVTDGLEIGGVHPDEVTTIIQEEPKDPTIEVAPEIPAAFPGGEKALMQWLSDNLVYPVGALERGAQGQVIIRFVVAPDGLIGNVEIVRRSVDPSLDQEAVRVVKKMPKWFPGKHNGKVVYAYYTLPVRFRLQN
jgi:protein TonB